MILHSTLFNDRTLIITYNVIFTTENPQTELIYLEFIIQLTRNLSDREVHEMKRRSIRMYISHCLHCEYMRRAGGCAGTKDTKSKYRGSESGAVLSLIFSDSFVLHHTWSCAVREEQSCG